eukprot:916609-Rhodomonas_salina.4
MCEDSRGQRNKKRTGVSDSSSPPCSSAVPQPPPTALCRALSMSTTPHLKAVCTSATAVHSFACTQAWLRST